MARQTLTSVCIAKATAATILRINLPARAAAAAAMWRPGVRKIIGHTRAGCNEPDGAHRIQRRAP